MFDAPLKHVVITLFQSACTLLPSAYRSALGTTVHPRRTPVKPAYLLKEQVSIATSSAPNNTHKQQAAAGTVITGVTFLVQTQPKPFCA